MSKYPEIATERFDNAKFHIAYCLHFIKKFIKGNVLEVGAGCGSFTKLYINNNFTSIILTELDLKNFNDLKNIFCQNSKIKILNKRVEDLKYEFDTILYLHVLEHIEDDISELKNAIKKLKKGGYIAIIVPANQYMYGNLDRAVGHYRRYSKKFFTKDLLGLKRIKLISLDMVGYFLYRLNSFFFKNEIFPSKLKIFIWDKLFTPITIIFDFIFNYKIGKAILAVYKKN